MDLNDSINHENYIKNVNPNIQCDQPLQPISVWKISHYRSPMQNWAQSTKKQTWINIPTSGKNWQAWSCRKYIAWERQCNIHTIICIHTCQNLTVTIGHALVYLIKKLLRGIIDSLKYISKLSSLWLGWKHLLFN